MEHPAAICSRFRDKLFECGISVEFRAGTSGIYYYLQSLPIFPSRAKFFFIFSCFGEAASPFCHLSTRVGGSVFPLLGVFFEPKYFENVQDFDGPEA